jgi:nucleoid-associated protein YgaU
MGLFDFVRDVGRKLTGGGGEAEEKGHHDEALEQHIRDLGLKVDDLDVSLDDGVATVRGTAASKAEAEKVVLALGNTQGVAQVDDFLAYHVEEPPSVFYTVVSGDTLSKIALAHYGNAMEYMVIFEANRPMLKDPDLIYPGQVLRIPPKGD